MASPDINTEDFVRRWTTSLTRDDVDPERIGILAYAAGADLP